MKFTKMPETIVIEASWQERRYGLDPWRYRELFQLLALRDYRVATSSP
jgi:hypothetical protein